MAGVGAGKVNLETILAALNTGFASMDQRFTSAEQRMDQRLTSLHYGFASVEQRLDRFERMLDAHAKDTSLSLRAIRGMQERKGTDVLRT
jgi:hypothetical protein